MKNSSSIRIGLLAAVSVFALVGCAGDNDGLQAITGEVTWGGEPLATGSITLTSPELGHSTGGSITDGRFAIPAKRGAKPGNYQVAIKAHLKTGKKVPSEIKGQVVDEVKQMIPRKYNERTKLLAEITQAGKNYFTFNLDEQ